MKWISVDEDLPKERELVLCCQENEHKYGEYLLLVRIGIDFYEIDGECQIDLSGSFGDITHWMPLPNKPKTK